MFIHIHGTTIRLLFAFGEVTRMKRWIREPKFRIGDVVAQGDAFGYQGTFLMTGDINNFPEELWEHIRNIYLKDINEIGDPVYKVEFLMPDDYDLFDEDYQRFADYIAPILERSGLEMLDD